jgi:acetyl-CoA carboxylase biotin carboxyl carrier protein
MITKGKHAGISATNYESQAKQVSNTTIEDVYDVEEITITENLYTVKSPMVGTFYRAPSPDSPPFVKIGDKVQKGQTLCIIEAMKIMNEIESEISGEIVDILLNDEDTVEYGQALMKIRR